ncbi:MAG TPA: M1 family aminopeptidase [Terriglobales bacterium]|nr:M1 family aminopeptidase [Terriglobales bacterium]
MLRVVLLVTLACLYSGPGAFGQEVTQRPGQPAAPPPAAPQQPNTEPTYQALRHIGLSGETVTVTDFVLRRDAGTFTFRTGSFYFLGAVKGKVTGAVFLGEGSFSLVPPIEMERNSLALLTKEPSLRENFSQLVLRFTDETYEEIKKAGSASSESAAGGAVSALNDIHEALHGRLAYNLSARVLMDVLDAQPGGLFVAFIRGTKYNDKMVYFIDPFGVPEMGNEEGAPPVFGTAPEEVALSTWDDNNWGVWAAFHYSHEYTSGQASGKQKNAPIDIESQKLDTLLEKSGRLRGDATTTLVSRVNGLRVLPFDLFRKLRVESVTGPNGQPLSFIQEGKNQDPQFFVILNKPLAAGERYTVRTIYEGKDAVSNEGGGNYFPIARHNWYPNSMFGDYASYELTFRVPKAMQTAATGTLLREYAEGDQNITEWRSEVPEAVAGFNFGSFKRKEVKLEKEGYVVEAYANTVQPDWVRSILNIGSMPAQGTQRIEQYIPPTGTMNTTTLMDKAMAEGQLSVQLYNHYFGAAPYKHVAITQQTACSFGQAWPALVYLPLCSFLDSTTRHSIFGSLPPYLVTYFKVVTAHEVAHQWWGHTVGWGGYRDQWMSEGFAHMSASLYLQLIQKNDKEFIQFWNDLRKQLTDRNAEGYRSIDVAPVTLGIRAIKRRTGTNVYRDLVYPKGAYILHMIRMLMWTPQKGDQVFQAMMQDFVRNYANQPATTEDFKAMVEKHMPPEIDIAQNRRMDWFFNEYVYGTALPHYQFTHSLTRGADGNPVLSFTLIQSNVEPNFQMLVPVYLELSSGKVVRLGTMPMTGNSTRDAQVPLGGMKDKPKRAILNYYNDVLCTQENVK